MFEAHEQSEAVAAAAETAAVELAEWKEQHPLPEGKGKKRKAPTVRYPRPEDSDGEGGSKAKSTPPAAKKRNKPIAWLWDMFQVILQIFVTFDTNGAASVTPVNEWPWTISSNTLRAAGYDSIRDNMLKDEAISAASGQPGVSALNTPKVQELVKAVLRDPRSHCRALLQRPCLRAP